MRNVLSAKACFTVRCSMFFLLRRVSRLGAECFFWVVCGMTRWHLNSEPIEIKEGAWPTRPTKIHLANDEKFWHRSWSKDPSKPTSLDDCLKNCVSYGFSFVGFTNAVRGKLSLGGFKIESD